LKKCLIFLLLTTLSLLLTPIAGANFGSQTPAKVGKFDPWPQTPPKIGRLELKQEYWTYMKEAARKYSISPYLIQAVCAIESRYDPYATSGRGQCIGLMQLHRDTARKYGVDPRNPRENIMGGAAVLARLLGTHNGDLRRVLHVYNAQCTSAYEREVIKAFNQAMSSGLTANHETRHHN
jgi:soluble lytic murein transglycosylase-like protein